MTGFDGVRQKRFSSFLVFGAAVNWLYGPLPFFSFSLISFLLLFLSLLPLIPLSTSGQKVFYSLPHASRAFGSSQSNQAGNANGMSIPDPTEPVPVARLNEMYMAAKDGILDRLEADGRGFTGVYAQ